VADVGVLQLHHPDGQVFAFEPGSLSMAFAVTGAPMDSDRFETLRAGPDLAIWASNVIGAPSVAATAADLNDARRLRAAIWHAADAVIDGRPLPVADRRVLNEAAAQPPMVPRLAADGTSSWRRPMRAGAVLSIVARDAIDLLGGPRASRLKRCQGLNCAIPFVDTSRPGTRRWCSMERCGNRAKARIHYHQHRQEVHR
jgi:predicted RNA-binding Zn ribbon-like protein